MANIFPPNTNKRFYGIAALVALAAAFVLGGIYYVNFSIPEYEPMQPVRFSHKLHAGDLKMSCTACHSAAQRSSRAGIPDTKSCLGCHQHILPDSPLIAPLREAADPQYPGYTGEPVRWVMVNRLSGHAYFNHMAHLNRASAARPAMETWRAWNASGSTRRPHAMVSGMPSAIRSPPAPAGGNGQFPLFRRRLPPHAFHPG